MSTPTDRQSPSESILASGLQKFDIKLYVNPARGLSQDDVWTRLIAVFGRWRHDEGEELVDLQDYAHVPDGPGIVLVSKRWVLSFDWSDGEPGILLSTRRGLSGTMQERFEAASHALLEKACRLLREDEFRDTLAPTRGELSIAVNDRVLFPSADEAAAELGPVVEGLIAKLYAPAAARLERVSDSGSRLKYRSRVDEGNASTPAAMLDRLGG